MDQGTSRWFGTSWETLGEVRDWSGNLPGGPERVRGPSRRIETGRVTIG